MEEMHLLDGLVEEIKVFTIVNNYTNIILGALVLLMGVLISTKIKSILKKVLNKLGVDSSTSICVEYGIYNLGILAAIVSTLMILNISTFSIVTIVVLLVLTMSLSLKRSFEGMSGAYMLFFFKAFKVGEYIETEDFEGTVVSMQTLSTTIKTINESIIVVPNMKLIKQNIVNHSREGIRRVDVKFKIPYKVDINFVKKILSDMIKENELVVKNKDFIISVDALRDDGIDIILIAWVKTEDYWNLYYSLTDDVEEVLRVNNIDISIPIRYISSKS